MKRYISLFLAILMLFSLCLVGCENKEDTPKDTTEAVDTSAPKDWEIRKILMVGSSYSYYYCDELFSIARADGIDLKVANLYVSGGTMAQHYGQIGATTGIYDFIIHQTSGKTVTQNATIDQALNFDNWDLITIQESYDPKYNVTNPTDGETTKQWVDKMVTFLREKYPQSHIMWQQVWSKEVGYQGPYTEENRANNFVGVPEVSKVLTPEKQQQDYEVIRDCALDLCESFDMYRIPSGDAWQMVRADERIGDDLCIEDGTHENARGQYLNGCVWYETLTGNSCIGNTWRPTDGSLPEEEIVVLQEFAHKAVAAVYGEDYAQ